MKNFGIYILLAILLIPTTSPAKSKQEPVIGSAIKLKGESSILDANARKATELKPNAKIRNASSILTGNSYATIQLNSPLTFVKIGKKSKVAIYADPTEKQYRIKLYTGFIKVLFKVSEQYESMKIETGNGALNLKNSKSLIIFNDVLNQTSVINYKGETQLVGKNASAVQMANNTYSALSSKSATGPSKPEFLTPHRLHELLNIFQISDQDKEQMEL